MREFLEIKLGGGKFTPMSPLFLYYEERKLEHSIHQDAGANPRDGFKVLAKMGCAPEPDAPYNIAAFTKPPQKKAVADATQFKIASYNRLNTLPDIQACLAGGTGVVLGFKVYDSFESDVVAQTGKVPMPQPNEALRGGHAVFAAGYNTDASWAGGGYLVVKNSWGTGWGDQGYFYMPFDYVNQNLVTDAWTALM